MHRIHIDMLRQDPEMAEKFWASLDPLEAEALLHDWTFLGREEQLPPAGAWAFWLYLAGRGAGKTRTGGEWVRSLILNGAARGGLIAPTSGDVRDVMVEGESGILASCWDHDYDRFGNLLGKPVYEPSKRRLTWANGAQCALYSADEPERLRGPQHEFIWADELCAWRYEETWDLAMFGLRLGKNPQAFISTTPKPKKLILDLMKHPHCVVTRGSTFSNRANLAPQFFEMVVKKYEGTRLGQQELEGIVLEEAEGALWNRELLDQARLNEIPRSVDFWFTRIVVGVDPATSSNKKSNETGIVVVGYGNDKHLYVLADYSGVYTPEQWSRKAREAYYLWQADYIVAEGNQGGEMVESTLNGSSHKQKLPVLVVFARRGKAARAEPVVAYWERGEAHMVGSHNYLEDQLCVWEPLSGDASPDRLDAMVWAATACVLGRGITDSGTLEGFY